MANQPTLETDRLVLRPFAPSDAADVQRLAGHREVALNTERIPHPYPDGAATAWIETLQPAFDEGREVTLAITLRGSGELVGAVGLVIDRFHDVAEIGYWISVPYWGKGVATEAARALVSWGFTTLGLERVQAAHFTRNPASGRVLQKIGMRYEGRKRHAMKKWDEYQDVEMYAVLREEWPGK